LTLEQLYGPHAGGTAADASAQVARAALPYVASAACYRYQVREILARRAPAAQTGAAYVSAGSQTPKRFRGQLARASRTATQSRTAE
jgi:hypothetical protein